MPILNTDEINQVPEQIGIYRIYVKDANFSPIPVSRFCAIDNSGLLYIGRTGRQNLRKRLYQFYASSNPQMLTHNHSGGLKYCNNPIIRQSLGGNHTLHFDFEVSQNPEEREVELLNAYSASYGEYPPLNK